MTYTTQQLQSMSDFEVNQALFEKLIPANCFSYEADKRPDSVSVYWNTAENEYVIDYCNNPSDIMPLAFERGFHIGDTYEARYKSASNPKGKAWLVSGDGCCTYKDTNPLRAIACLLLLMED